MTNPTAERTEFRMKRKMFIAAIGAAVTIALISTVVSANLGAGKKAPDFTLKSIDSKNLTLSDSFKKPAKVVVLDIWATWCPPCRAEIPYIVDLNKQYKDKGLQVIGVSIDTDASAVKDFAKKNKMDYSLAVDPQAGVVGRQFKLTGIPATYVIDKKGVIRYTHSGFPLDKAEQKKEAAKLETEVKELLAEKE